jgi:phosphoribosylcarboxyaminoimidazole (NCAIR) mutase
VKAIWPKMQKVVDVFKEMNIAYEIQILSVHRLPAPA